MLTISATELKRHFEKYLEIGKTEQIKVTYEGEVIFTIVPERQELMNRWESLFGTLPKDASFDTDINRE